MTIGGLTSFTTTWLTQRAQVREKLKESGLASRQAIFGEFIVEASRRCGGALSHSKDDVYDLVQLYAIAGKTRLWASSPAVNAAQQAMEAIIISTWNQTELTTNTHDGSGPGHNEES